MKSHTGSVIYANSDLLLEEKVKVDDQKRQG